MLTFQLSSPVPVGRPRLSWRRRKSTSSTDTQSFTNKRKRTVRFSRQRPQMIKSNYEVTESLQKLLWYRPKDLKAIHKQVEATVREEVMGCNREHCCRGLESPILDCISPSNSRKLRYEKFIRGFLALQESQKNESGTKSAHAEVLREYCLASGSQQQETCARKRAKQDAIVALKQNETSLLVVLRKHSQKSALPLLPPRAALGRSLSEQSASCARRAT